MASDPMCICGHPESDHYTYCLNGHDQTRCKACDPFIGRRFEGVVNIEADGDSYVARMNVAADHDFQPVEEDGDDDAE